jgi:hypothetical protein
MSQGDDKPKNTNIFKKIGPLGFYSIIIGISLLVIYLLWASFGYIGPTFSSDLLNKQQTQLRADYGLPPKPIITDPTILQTPPSLRGFDSKNNTNSTPK